LEKSFVTLVESDHLEMALGGRADKSADDRIESGALAAGG
jgi:hypothetical protein